MKGTVIASIGEVDYFLRFPNGRIERVTGLARFIWLAIWLTFRGYVVQLEEHP